MDASDENSKRGRKPVLDDAKRRAILAIGGWHWPAKSASADVRRHAAQRKIEAHET